MQKVTAISRVIRSTAATSIISHLKKGNFM
uniref:Uncharacterized protein n=1 Tax=Rhizophora mucronata TaxID=61149 RepID=A0A2P2R3J4_RHIMU